ncbi:hypothetical protein ATY41_10260 [Leifsonia xyli subsp. xyli]|uniref:Uncharacterized protein n=3 Tax=Leifsonia xyli TaxID=1575 RepID=Q6AH87_LEIXX|nr:hypothetical protein Lxx02020 [Leifsonia xyli subsp. xyli str. CTCB07]ODA90358.1 hypothetical protein ATY41_10260 [Leifsonia xyli subsp. xyli]
MLSGDIYSTDSALGMVYLREDGNVYLENVTMINAPAGVTFKQVSGGLDTGNGAVMVGAIATDGTPYFSYGSSTFAHSSNVPASTSTVNGIWFLGDEGQVYGGGGAHIAAPADVSFTSISASQNPVTGTWMVAGVTADGSAYVSESMGDFSKAPVTDVEESAIGMAFLSSDGDVYTRTGTKIAAPAGVKFKELTGTINSGNQAWMLGAIATDGTPYSSYNSAAFAKNNTLASAESSANGMFFLGADGQVYSGSGVKVAAPAGVSFKSISASVHPLSGAWEVGGTATDGKSYT